MRSGGNDACIESFSNVARIIEEEFMFCNLQNFCIVEGDFNLILNHSSCIDEHFDNFATCKDTDGQGKF